MGAKFRVTFRPYRKPGNAYAYIPFNAFHGCHAFRGWMLAELLRLVAHSGTLELWKEEGSIFYHHLCSRGYPRSFLRTVLQEVTWTLRSATQLQLIHGRGRGPMSAGRSEAKSTRAGWARDHHFVRALQKPNTARNRRKHSIDID
jgi:hypothetical protein